MDRKPRSFYAIEYAYGRTKHTGGGTRANKIHQFASKAEQVRFVSDCERQEINADELKATDPRVRRAQRYAAQGLEWPQSVAD
ncbi:MAG TPA: hypothetical protein VGE07_00540 [Herpetosiphonaceae bacterium]